MILPGPPFFDLSCLSSAEEYFIFRFLEWMQIFAKFPSFSCLRLFPVPCSCYSHFLNNWAEVISRWCNGSKKDICRQWINPYQASVSFLYPLKLSENRRFLMFSGLDQKYVNILVSVLKELKLEFITQSAFPGCS